MNLKEEIEIESIFYLVSPGNPDIAKIEKSVIVESNSKTFLFPIAFKAYSEVFWESIFSESYDSGFIEYERLCHFVYRFIDKEPELLEEMRYLILDLVFYFKDRDSRVSRMVIEALYSLFSKMLDMLEVREIARIFSTKFEE